MESFDLIILGSGPAGSSTALHLSRLAPQRALRTLILEKAQHPRPKLCGGGLTFYGRQVLNRLGLTLPVPYVPIHNIRFRFADRQFDFRLRHAFWVLRRDEFDAWLAGEAQRQGVTLREGEAAQHLEMDAGGILVYTARQTYRAQAVVAADGAKGLSRRAVAPSDAPSRISRLLEVLTPTSPALSEEFLHNMATFDFTPMAQGVQGYYWDFPCWVGGEAHVNRGIYDSRIVPKRSRAPLKETLAAALQERGYALAALDLAGHPEQWFDRNAPFSRPRLLLVGDAAGVDPFLGEGIAYALRYGQVAAQTVADAFAKDDFAFDDYRARILAHPVGRSLSRRVLLARLAYRFHSRRFLRLLWPVLGLMRGPIAWWLAPQATADIAST